jgi:DNA-binding NarL/FixJ family response regulator
MMNTEIDSIRIVIIEDDATIREGYIFLLGKDPSFDIVGAYPSFEIAEKYLSIDRPAVVLLDVQLPGISGVEALPRIKRLLPRAQVLILTVYESEEVIFAALQNGASGYLTKNTSSEKIIMAIKEVVSGGGALSTQVAKLVVQSFRKNIQSPLTKRETQILEGIAGGKSRRKIAAELFIDMETVKTHIKNIYNKLDVNSKDEALKVARESRFI